MPILELALPIYSFVLSVVCPPCCSLDRCQLPSKSAAALGTAVCGAPKLEELLYGPTRPPYPVTVSCFGATVYSD